MDIDGINVRIYEKQEAISAVQKELKSVQEDLEKKKSDLAKSLYAHREKSRKPASLTTQKRSVAEAMAESEGLTAVISQLETELKDLEIEKKSVELFENQGQRFLNAMEICERESKRASELSEILQKALSDFSDSTDMLIDSVSESRQGYAQILGGLPATFSLRSFQKGVLEKARGKELEDRKALIEDLNTQLLTFSQVPTPSDETVIPLFAENVKKLIQWKKFVASGDIFEKNAFVYRQPKPLQQVRTARVTMQPIERARHIITHPEQYSRKDLIDAKKALEQAGAKAQASREAPRQARTKRVGGVIH